MKILIALGAIFGILTLLLVVTVIRAQIGSTRRNRRDKDGDAR